MGNLILDYFFKVICVVKSFLMLQHFFLFWRLYFGDYKKGHKKIRRYKVSKTLLEAQFSPINNYYFFDSLIMNEMSSLVCGS